MSIKSYLDHCEDVDCIYPSPVSSPVDEEDRPRFTLGSKSILNKFKNNNTLVYSSSLPNEGGLLSRRQRIDSTNSNRSLNSRRFSDFDDSWTKHYEPPKTDDEEDFADDDDGTELFDLSEGGSGDSRRDSSQAGSSSAPFPMDNEEEDEFNDALSRINSSVRSKERSSWIAGKKERAKLAKIRLRAAKDRLLHNVGKSI